MIYVYEKSPERITKDLEQFVPREEKEVLGYQKDPRSELLHEISSYNQTHQRGPSYEQDQRYSIERGPTFGQDYRSDYRQDYNPRQDQRQVRFGNEPGIRENFGGRDYDRP